MSLYIYQINRSLKCYFCGRCIECLPQHTLGGQVKWNKLYGEHLVLITFCEMERANLPSDRAPHDWSWAKIYSGTDISVAISNIWLENFRSLRENLLKGKCPSDDISHSQHVYRVQFWSSRIRWVRETIGLCRGSREEKRERKITILHIDVSANLTARSTSQIMTLCP